jgi:hypothetical protein
MAGKGSDGFYGLKSVGATARVSRRGMVSDAFFQHGSVICGVGVDYLRCNSISNDPSDGSPPAPGMRTSRQEVSYFPISIVLPERRADSSARRPPHI